MIPILGQIFGWLSAVFGFITYQCKTQKQVLLSLSMAGVCMILSYLLAGAYSGTYLNIIGLFRNYVYYAKDKPMFSHKWWPTLFAVVMGLIGFMSWQGPISLLIIVPLVAYTLVLGAGNVQNTRICILFTSTMVMLYNIYYHVWGAASFEFVCIVSAAIGIIRFRKDKSAKETAN